MRKILSIAAFLTGGMLAAQTTQTFSYTGSIQTFTVPACVTSMTIEARGAQGGWNTSSVNQPGMGAIMIGTFAVTPGQQIKILVGQQPSNGSGNGGGGGTFVTDMSNNPLVVAGGGGGSSQGNDSPAKHGQITTSGGTGAGGGGVGGTMGSGGSIGSSGFQSGAGGGLTGNGADGWTTSTGGLAFVNGGSGGTTNAPANGGYGGGGSGSSYVVGGGGGGYSGGGSGGNTTAGVGGGGGSYNGGTNQTNTGGANTGNGQVILTYTAGPSAPAVSGNATACYGEVLTLTASTVPGAITYNWTLDPSGTIMSGSGTNVISVMHNAAGVMTASVTVTDACGTGSAGTFTYTVYPQPAVTITYSPTAICDGDTVTFTASGAASYAWSSGGTNATETLVVTAGNYNENVTSTSVNGCTSNTGQGYTVNANPVVALGADTNVCGNITLDAMNAGSAYLWSDNSTNQTLLVTNSGTYNVMISDANGCSSSDTITIGVGGNFTTVGSAAMTFVCTGEPTVALSGTPAAGVWTGAGVFGNSFEPDSAGAGTHNLIYTYTDSLGCSGTDTVSITVDLCLSANAALNENPVSVYPNPNNGLFTITFDQSLADAVIEVTDAQGRVVYASDKNSGSTMQLDLSGEASGIYFLRVTAANVNSTQKIILNK